VRLRTPDEPSQAAKQRDDGGRLRDTELYNAESKFAVLGARVAVVATRRPKRLVVVIIELTTALTTIAEIREFSYDRLVPLHNVAALIESTIRAR
jgi:hypothetical protein